MKSVSWYRACAGVGVAIVVIVAADVPLVSSSQGTTALAMTNLNCRIILLKDF